VIYFTADQHFDHAPSSGGGMKHDYLDDMFEEKRIRDERRRISDAALLERRRRYTAHHNDICKWLGDILCREAARFNSYQSDEKDRIESIDPPPSGVVVFRKRTLPDGSLDVSLDKQTERVVCKYSYSRPRYEGVEVVEYDAVIDDSGNFHLVFEERVIPTDALAETILGDYFRRMIG
jgi:hypothetical protein